VDTPSGLERQRKVRASMAGNSHERGQSVAGRLLRVLEAFTAERPHLTTAEISRRTGIPPSTLYRLLAELTGRGVVQRSADGRYAVGLRLWEIGRLAPCPTRLVEVAAQHLQDLAEAAWGDVQLAVLAGPEALCVEAAGGHGRATHGVRAGSRVPLTSTAIGQVLLAHAPSDVLEQVLANRARPAEMSTVPVQRLRALLADIRRAGVAVCHLDARSLVVAAPVVDPLDGGIAAVALTVPEGAEVRLMVPLVRRTSRRISRELPGATAPGAIGVDAVTPRHDAVRTSQRLREVHVPLSGDGPGDRRNSERESPNRPGWTHAI
jgi:DNA-binding IclR family transcriptional regulator